MARVIVIGGANVDVKGRSTETLIAGTSNPGHVVVSAGGVGRNIAHNLAQLGLDVAMIAPLGDDANGRMLKETTSQAGVDMTPAVSVDVPTGTYLAVLDAKGEMVSAINDMRAMEQLTPAHLAARSDLLQRAELLVADCNLTVECLGWLCAFARQNQLRLLVEPVSVPKIAKLEKLPTPLGLYCITPNRSQLEALGQSADRAQALARIHAMGVANVVVHLGADGALASDAASAVVPIPPRHVTVRDVTGAGDAAVSGLICGLMEGRSLAEAARMGQAAAALKLQSADSVARSLNRVTLQTLLEQDL